MGDDKFEIRAVFFKDSGQWVAQCLEHDICVHARTLDDLQRRLLIALDAEREESVAQTGEPFGGIEPAPMFFHELWERRAGLFEPVNGSSLTSRGLSIALADAA